MRHQLQSRVNNYYHNPVYSTYHGLWHHLWAPFVITIMFIAQGTDVSKWEVNLVHRYLKNIDCSSFVMCQLLASHLPRHFWLFKIFFWLQPITVLKRQTRQAAHAINQSILLRWLWFGVPTIVYIFFIARQENKVVSNAGLLIALVGL